MPTIITPDIARRMAADAQTAEKFFGHLSKLVNAFSAQNPGSANAVLSVLIGTAARTAKLCGMTPPEWREFAWQVWTDLDKAEKSR